MSFFDEDDEPPRTARTRVRQSPPPRRGRVSSGGHPDAQTLLMRRLIAGVAGVVVLLLLFFVVRACSNSRADNALRDYNRQVSGIGRESSQTGEQFFAKLGAAKDTSAPELYQSILGFKGSAEQSLKQAQALSVPGDVAPAQQSLLIALELRRDALEKVAAEIRPAMGDEGEVADEAIRQIAGQMRALDASDVLYEGRVVPFIKSALDRRGLGGDIIKSTFLGEVSWVSPPFVASQLGQALSRADEDGGDGNSQQPTGPGLHGTNLDATSYGSVTLQPGTSNRLTYVKGQPFTVSFTNGGENDEFNVRVTLRIERSSGDPITVNKTVDKVAQGEKATVELPLNSDPPLGTALTITTIIHKVPGEENTDNNRASYPTLFVEG